MYRDQTMHKNDPELVQQVKESTWRKVLKIAKPGDKIFTTSWSDFFIDEADQWRAEAWDVIRAHPQFIWQLLTKRIERVRQCLPEDWGEGWAHVWLGVSVESQAYAWRVAALCDTPAAVRFISYEPALGPLDLQWIEAWEHDSVGASMIRPFSGIRTDMARPCRDAGKIDWIIMGGESGNDTGLWRYRPAAWDWFAYLAKQCEKNNVPFFMKQAGTYLAKLAGMSDRTGLDLEQMPEIVRSRQFPKLAP